MDRISAALDEFGFDAAKVAQYGERLTQHEPLIETQGPYAEQAAAITFSAKLPEDEAATQVNRNWPLVICGTARVQMTVTSLAALAGTNIVKLPNGISYFPCVLAHDAETNDQCIRVYMCGEERELPALICAVARAGERGMHMRCGDYEEACRVLSRTSPLQRGMRLAHHFEGIQFSSSDQAEVTECEQNPRHAQRLSREGGCIIA